MKRTIVSILIIGLLLFGCGNDTNPASSSPGDGPFITIWKTDNSGPSNDYQITIPTAGSGYNYNVDWGDGSISEGVTWGNITHTYSAIGVYTVKITGDFPRIAFFANGSPTDKDKIISIESWGDIEWHSMEEAFAYCSNLTLNTNTIPDFSKLTSLSAMFLSASSLQGGDIGGWDVSNVTDMSRMFYGATCFNGDISNWDVSNVLNMGRMFQEAHDFNQDIGNWDVSNVTQMHCMFETTEWFSANLESWDVSNVTVMWRMFYGALSMDGDLRGWDVSKVTNHDDFQHASNIIEPLWSD
ncbi:MAG: BspA family leucine-rich repeat surface protein [Candidatus Sabulitectum sp.]|nr:BspA family leucine-rich repeat surface protein [Candidatus Sabulitectum sp.]